MRLDSLDRLRPPARNRRWYVISAVVHAALVGALILLFRPFRPAQSVTYIDLGTPPNEELSYAGPGGGKAPAHIATRPAPRPSVAAPSEAQVQVVPEAAAPAPAAPVIGEEEDTLPVDTHRQLGPQYGDGRLWVRVGDAERGEVPARMAADSVPMKIASIDSALARKIRIFMDTVPPDSFATRSAPKWTTEIAGKTWGIDGKWIYLGGLKIPTAILALLPLPANAGGNYALGQREAQLNAMRRDILEAAQRANTAVEFRKYVKEVRERKEREHDMEKAQRIPPTPGDTTRAAEPLYP